MSRQRARELLVVSCWLLEGRLPRASANGRQRARELLIVGCIELWAFKKSFWKESGTTPALTAFLVCSVLIWRKALRLYNQKLTTNDQQLCKLKTLSPLPTLLSSTDRTTAPFPTAHARSPPANGSRDLLKAASPDARWLPDL